MPGSDGFLTLLRAVVGSDNKVVSELTLQCRFKIMSSLCRRRTICASLMRRVRSLTKRATAPPQHHRSDWKRSGHLHRHQRVPQGNGVDKRGQDLSIALSGPCLVSQWRCAGQC
jgi:hypothetical protein